MTATVRLGISSCLLGERVRFDGGHKHQAFLTETLGPHVEWVPVCPELEVGMGVPREAVNLRRSSTGPRMLGRDSGTDWTDRMHAWATGRLDDLSSCDLDGFVLKKDSPSCGLERVRLYPEDAGQPTRDGRGLWASALAERFPALPLEEEGRLNDPRLRENFIERVFAHRRWREFMAANPSVSDLQSFHARAKLSIMAHSPQAYRELGRFVAGVGARTLTRSLREYGERLQEALRRLATPAKHTNVLQHLAGHLKREIDEADRRELANVIERYRNGLVPLVVPLTLLQHHFRRHPVPWATGQTYLDPYPSELMLRNHV